MSTAKSTDDLTAITPAGTACFVHVWEPFAFKPAPGQAPKDPDYSLMLVFDDGTDITDLKKLAGRAASAKWGADAKQMAASGQLRWPWRPGREYAKYGEPFDKKGAVFIRAASRSAPGVVDSRAKPIMKQQDFYAGCRARISVYAHAYDTMGNKGVTFLLNNMQKVADGKKLAGTKADAEKEFGAIAGSDSGDDSDDLF